MGMTGYIIVNFTVSGTSPADNSVASEYAFRRGLGSSIEHRDMRKRTIGADTPLGGEPSDILSAYEERNLLYEGVSIVHRMFDVRKITVSKRLL